MIKSVTQQLSENSWNTLKETGVFKSGRLTQVQLVRLNLHLTWKQLGEVLRAEQDRDEIR